MNRVTAALYHHANLSNLRPPGERRRGGTDPGGGLVFCEASCGGPVAVSVAVESDLERTTGHVRLA